MANARRFPNRSTLVGAAAIGALILFAVLGPLVAAHGPYESDFVHGVGPDSLPVGPGWYFPLGADRIFRDVFVRLAVAARLSLAIAISATVVATTIGASVGIVSGYFAGSSFRVPWLAVVGAGAAVILCALGRPVVAAAIAGAGGLTCLARRSSGLPLDVDVLLMRSVDVWLAFPFLLLVMAIGAAVESTSAFTVFVILGVTGWPGVARVLRAKTLQVRAQDYVLAARALGQSTPRILLFHVLPNVAGPLTVSAAVLASQMIVADSVISYLGVGMAPPTPTWGRMLYEGQPYLTATPWLVLAPSAAMLVAAWGFIMLGEGLRHALDPR